jgi:DNA-binding MarR family transcriptional regulator
MTTVTLQRMLAALRLFRSLDEVIPASAVETFLVVADIDAGVTRKEIMNRCGMSYTSAYRNLMILAEDHPQAGRRGLKLLEKRKDPDEPRRNLWRLSPRGRDLRQRVLDTLGM